MEPNSNIFRQILFQVKDAPFGAIIQFQDLNCEGFDKATIVENVSIMIEMGLLEGQITTTMTEGPDNFLIRKITLKGREFLKNTQSDIV